MILLDTDHVTVLHYRTDPRSQALRLRLDTATDRRLAITVVTVEEQSRGWLGEIRRCRKVHEQIPLYERLAEMVRFLSAWEITLLDTRAADQFERLRKQKVRIGTQDLKIASIALVNDALLLSANSRDFRKVPALRVENWLA